MKKLLSLCLFLVCALVQAQTTSVTATVSDSTSQAWINGTWTLTFVPNPANPNINIYNINGTPLSSSVINQKGTMDNSGALSFTTYKSNSISPYGSSWKLVVCPLANSLCGTYNFSTGSNSSMDLSSALTSIIPVPNFPAVANSYGYNDNEARLTLPIGGTYWNVISSCQRYYNGSYWNCYNSSLVPIPTVLGKFPIGNGPLQNAIDANNNFWVASAADDAVYVYNQLGQQIHKFGSMTYAPDCTVIDGYGYIWLCDQDSNKVTKMKSDGTIIGNYNVGQGPDAIAVDQNENIWVSNSADTIVTELANNGTLIGNFPLGGDTISWNVVVDPAGNIWSINFLNNSVTKLDPAGGVLCIITVGKNPQVSQFDSQGNLWVPNQGDNTVNKISPNCAVLATFTLPTMPASGVGGLTIDGNNNVWLWGGGIIAELNSAGQQINSYNVGTWFAYGNIDSFGNLWVSDNHENFVIKMSTASKGVPTPLFNSLIPQVALNGGSNTFGSPVLSANGYYISVVNGPESFDIFETGSNGVGSSFDNLFPNSDIWLGFGASGTAIWSYSGPYQLAVGNSGNVVETDTSTLKTLNVPLTPALTNGNPDINLPVWNSTSPTPACLNGTPTTLTSALRLQSIGKISYFNVNVTDTTNGTCATGITIPMPITSKVNSTAACYLYTGSVANGAIGYMVGGGTTLYLFTTSGGFPGGSGYSINCNGAIETP